MKGLIRVLLLLLFVLRTPAFIIDHTNTDLEAIPEAWIDSAKAKLHIGYEHTSHGSQIPSGMAAIESYLGSPYLYNDGPATGQLDLDDDGMESYYSGARDLGYCPEWVHATRSYLAANTDVNVIMWSWCALHANETEINEYLDSMSALEAEYPDVRFVYMTGHSNGGGESGSFHIWNSYIRTFCEDNDRVLFDFYDIECYDPDGNYYGDLNIDDDLTYTGGNWATEWLAANPLSQLDTLTGICGSCAHSDAAAASKLNCILKGKAAWWMWARLAGWDGTDTVAATPSISPPAGSYEENVTVSISCRTADADIRYTTDGSDPTAVSDQYTEAFILSADATVKARAYKDGLSPSSVAEASYTIIEDTAGPEIEKAYPNATTGIIIEFSEALDTVTAETAGNYIVNNGITVVSAVLGQDGASVLLTVTPAFTNGGMYTVTVSGVEDLNGNPAADGTSVSFGYNACTAYWSFDETTGDTARDGSGYGSHAFTGGAEWTADAAVGGALAFDGSDTLILEAKTFGIDTTGAFTIAFWFKYTEAGGAMAVLGQYYRPFGVFFSGSRVRTCVRTGAGTNYETGDSTLMAGTWYHCALAFEDGSRIMYLNGGVDNTSSLAGSAGISSGQTFWLGQGFSGSLDEVRIYNRALTQAEVQALVDDAHTTGVTGNPAAAPVLSRVRKFHDDNGPVRFMTIRGETVYGCPAMSGMYLLLDGEGRPSEKIIITK